jgi:hypothetical protein
MVTADVVRKQYHEGLMSSFDVNASEQVEMVLRNEAFFETVDCYDFIWPVRAISLNKARAVWQRSWVPLSRIQEMGKKGFYSNVDDVRPFEGDTRRIDHQTRFAAQNLNPTTETDNPENSEVELWERWEDDRLTVIANRRIVLRDDPNPFDHKRKPFVDFAPVERPFSLHGVGVIKMLFDMNEDLSALRRQRRDAITFTINPMWKATEGFKQDDVKMRPGGVIQVPDTEDFEPATVPNVNLSASYQEEQNAKNDMQAVTGAFDYLSGVNPGGVQTATGVATVTQEGNKRIAEMVAVFSERAMKPFGYQMASLVLQYLDNDVAIPLYRYPEAAQAWSELKGVAAPRIVEVDREDITTAGKVLPLPNVGADKTASDVQKRSDAVQVIQAIAPILAAPQPVIDPKALVEYILEQFGVDRHDRAKIMNVQAAQSIPVAPTSNGTPPAGGVVGAPGVAGPTG